MTDVITYEQPLNELIRACLRIEQLFLQIDHQIKDTSTLGTRNMVAAIINMLQLIDRPDLKAKLAKELNQQMLALARLEHTPEIDQKKLRELLKQLDELSRWFIDNNKKIGQNLREVELLNNLRLHLANPGGGCGFDIPVYHSWLQQPADERLQVIKSWLAEFETIRRANDLILRLAREGAKTQRKTATNGFHQELLEPQNSLKLIRVSIAKSTHAYPEVSIGRHFLSIRFYAPDIIGRPAQYPRDLSFSLAYCN